MSRSSQVVNDRGVPWEEAKGTVLERITTDLQPIIHAYFVAYRGQRIFLLLLSLNFCFRW